MFKPVKALYLIVVFAAIKDVAHYSLFTKQGK
jgi:hypothetical protein